MGLVQYFRTRRLRVDPYFASGVASALVLGAAFAARSVRSSVASISVVPPSVTSRFDALHLGRTLGTPGRGVQVAEFGDYQCPACAAAHRVNWPLLQRLTDEGRITYTVYDLPLPSHGNAVPAAVIAQCVAAREPGRFWAYRDVLFAEQRAWQAAYPVEPRLLNIAARLGIDTAATRACAQRESESRGRALREGWVTASTAAMSYAPILSINGRVIPWVDFRAQVEAALAAAR